MKKKITRKNIRKELVRVNKQEDIQRTFMKVTKTNFRNFKSNLETKVSIIKSVEKIIMEKKRSVSILEIGAGAGDLSFVCLKFLGNKIKEYMVTELNASHITLIRKNMKPYKNVKIGKLDVLFPGSFNLKYDIVIFSEVVEHLTEIEKEIAFINLNKFLNKNGYLIISCPITDYLGKRIFYSRFKGLKERVRLDYRTIRSHIAIPSITQIISLFYRKGFTDVKIKPLPIILPFKKKVIEPIINIIEYFSVIFPNWFRVYLSPGVVVVGRKTSPLDNNWYNDDNYLLKYLPPKKVLEDKWQEKFVNYKYIEKNKKY